MREVITIEIGQAGIQSGNSFWEQFCAEIGIENNGKQKKPKNDHISFRSFFQETEREQFISRNLAVDSEPNVIDNRKNGPFAALFNSEFLINEKEDAGNIFARGHYTIGRKIIDKVNDRLRKLADDCDYCIGFFISHSVGGGTGSGLGSLILERLAIDYRKKPKIGFEIYPSPNFSTCVVEPYNSLLATHWLTDHTEVSLWLDNEAIYNICQKQLHIQKPNFENLNRLISKVTSSLACWLQLEGSINTYLSELQTYLVPFPRLHFMTTGMSPIIPKTNIATTSKDIQKITDDCFKPHNWFVKFTDFNAIEDKYMAISLHYHGDVTHREAHSMTQWLKDNKKVSLIEWCPFGFRVNKKYTPMENLESDDIEVSNKSLIMIGNNTAIPRIFRKRIGRKYDMMYSQRAFVHWYVREGMELDDFSEARQDLLFLENDYLDVLSDQPTDESDNNDGDY